MSFPMRSRIERGTSGLRALGIGLVLAAAILGGLPSAQADEDAARCFPKRGDHFLYDEAGWLGRESAHRIEGTLRALYARNGLQFVVVITENLCGKSVAQYANELGDAWGVGSASEDNGVVLVVVPKRPGRKGHVFLAPGRGIQDRLPDVRAKRITRDVMVPHFQRGERAQGILAGIAAVAQALGYGPVAADTKPARPQNRAEKKENSVVPLWIISLLVVLYLGLVLGEAARKSSSWTRKAGLFALAPVLGAGVPAILAMFFSEHLGMAIVWVMAAVAALGWFWGLRSEDEGAEPDSMVLGREASYGKRESAFEWSTSFSDERERNEVEWGGGRFNGGGAGSSW